MSGAPGGDGDDTTVKGSGPIRGMSIEMPHVCSNNDNGSGEGGKQDDKESGVEGSAPCTRIFSDGSEHGQGNNSHDSAKPSAFGSTVVPKEMPVCVALSSTPYCSVVLCFSVVPNEIPVCEAQAHTCARAHTRTLMDSSTHCHYVLSAPIHLPCST